MSVADRVHRRRGFAGSGHALSLGVEKGLLDTGQPVGVVGGRLNTSWTVSGVQRQTASPSNCFAPSSTCGACGRWQTPWMGWRPRTGRRDSQEKAGLCSLRTRKACTPGGNLRVETSRAFDTGGHDGLMMGPGDGSPWRVPTLAPRCLLLVSPAWLVRCAAPVAPLLGREYDATIGGDGPRHAHCSETQAIRLFDAGPSKSKAGVANCMKALAQMRAKQRSPLPAGLPLSPARESGKATSPPPERDADWREGPRWATAGRDRTPEHGSASTTRASATRFARGGDGGAAK